MRFEVQGSDGRPVRAVRHGPGEGPAVLVAHGFKGFKDWGSFPWICDRIAEAGLGAIRFDFSHNGVEARDFDRLDLFLLDTPRRHQEDLAALAAAVPGPLGLLGHSRGGADAILFAAGEPRVACVATLASAAYAGTRLADVEDVLRARGYVPIPNARTKQEMPVGRHAFEEAERLSVQAAARALDRPLLLVHGSADESVPIAQQAKLASWAANARVVVLEGAGHTFGAVHPFRGPTPDLQAAMEQVVPFFREHLVPAGGQPGPTLGSG
jgi:pimeloyl-ACP methyl ester carboxylesterase